MKPQRTRLRGSRLSSRPFYTTVFLLSLLVAYSFLIRTGRGANHNGVDNGLLRKRSEEPECSEVHQAEDKCAFVKQYCADDDAGLIPYLTLYFCGFHGAKPVALIILVGWLGLLFTTIGIAASDFFSVNLSTIATILGLSESLAGVTFLAFGNGSPDVFSTFAAMGSNSASMAVGELVGAACFITGVVAGSMALVREFRVDKKTYARDICFFIVAICFTMYFLADGHLRFWECWVMIVYYIIYVITVVGQHWWMSQRKRRQRREGEARSHVYSSLGTSIDELAGEPYRDDPDDVDQSSSSTPDISALETGPRIDIDVHPPDSVDDEEAEEQAEEDFERMLAAEVTSNMRVLRTRKRRSNTINPIRPSLVGALEFRSALAHLQRESNHRLSTIHGHGRSYSEAQFRRARSYTGEPSLLSPNTISGHSALQGARSRALSSGNAPNSLGIQPPLFVHTEGIEDSADQQTHPGQATLSPVPVYTVGGSLAPPPVPPPGGSLSPGGNSIASDGVSTFPNFPGTLSRRSSHSISPPGSPFPMYTDSPDALSPGTRTPHLHERSDAMLPSPGLRDLPFGDLPSPTDHPRPVSWWPYWMLPPPHVLFTTLFPTLQGWRDKTIWDKFVSTISVPSIFLLVITLPVVESESTEDSLVAETLLDIASVRATEPPSGVPPVVVETAPEEEDREWERYASSRRSRGRSSSYLPSRDISPLRITFQNEDTLVAGPSTEGTRPSTSLSGKPASEFPSLSNANDECQSWNRWLVCVQIFTGPLFSVLILWLNFREDLDSPGKVAVRMVLFTLLGSSVLLGLLLSFTSEETRPKYHYVLCFMGFIISIAWISTIAGEVVGVLKTFGIVLNISEALLGLTIFAAGNSVGDLIADITVARLGYPVMALAACFGGPMLNILLGIGIGGVMMMIRSASLDHKNHPDQPYHYGPYNVQVGATLFISAITLLVTLVGMLVIVPMNKWVLSRKIGWTLIALWAVTTVLNVIIEVTGVWGQLD
ncbi:unnamed protein product [Clonostachys byssicola]|uniref:Sodium/calcium exchanger membrane region domain-containing protein n=1 Tax=Clonostachys byssicola TaxID=160290 RepID=A0A9N9XU56_9HYPO|nr:unnamed protein product [Clonostachys byssicola]